MLLIVRYSILKPTTACLALFCFLLLLLSTHTNEPLPLFSSCLPLYMLDVICILVAMRFFSVLFVLFVAFLLSTTAFSSLLRHPAPQFSAKAVVGEKFEDLSLADYEGKWVVLFFYPFDWTV